MTAGGNSIRWRGGLLLRLLPTLAALIGCSEGAPIDPGRATVVEVVDGDTVRLQFGPVTETARLLGIDAPESVHPSVPDQCFGAEASAELGRLLPVGTVVDVARDVDGRDHYGRLLLHLRRAEDGLNINHHLVEQGFAAAAFYEPNHHDRRRFLDAQRRAEAEQRGLWALCDGADQPLD